MLSELLKSITGEMQDEYTPEEKEKIEKLAEKFETIQENTCGKMVKEILVYDWDNLIPYEFALELLQLRYKWLDYITSKINPYHQQYQDYQRAKNIMNSLSENIVDRSNNVKENLDSSIEELKKHSHEIEGETYVAIPNFFNIMIDIMDVSQRLVSLKKDTKILDGTLSILEGLRSLTDEKELEDIKKKGGLS